MVERLRAERKSEIQEVLNISWLSQDSLLVVIVSSKNKRSWLLVQHKLYFIWPMKIFWYCMQSFLNSGEINYANCLAIINYYSLICPPPSHPPADICCQHEPREPLHWFTVLHSENLFPQMSDPWDCWMLTPWQVPCHSSYTDLSLLWTALCWQCSVSPACTVVCPPPPASCSCPQSSMWGHTSLQWLMMSAWTNWTVRQKSFIFVVMKVSCVGAWSEVKREVCIQLQKIGGASTT